MVGLLHDPILLLGFGWPELLLILAIVILIFGSGKLANIGKGLGEGIRNFRKGLKGGDEQDAEAPKAEKRN